ncbi:MAG: methyltransferase [Kofleriaceae bacterium]|nr:methyltransferase [Kofleriaceae bacterium]
MQFSHGSKRRLSPRDLGRFPSESLFDRVARAVCRAECLPRKELYESWEVARRVRRRVRGGRVLEVASGHALLAHLLLILDDTSPTAIAIDPHTPPSAAKLATELVTAWPRLAGRVDSVRTLADVTPSATDVVVSAHACGGLTDDVLAAAIAARAPVAVLPCCQVVAPSPLDGWLDGPLAVDVARAQRLVAAGYAVHTQTIDPAITPKNRLLVGVPTR